MLLEPRSSKENSQEISDEDILALSQKSPSLFAVLVSRYEDAFYRKAHHVLGNREEVEDVVQETFTKIYLHAGKFKKQPGASFKSWGYKILLNTCFSHYQKLKRDGIKTQVLESEIFETIPDTSRSPIEEKDLRESIIMTLSRMPKHLSRVLAMQFLEGRSQREIAGAEGISEVAVKTRVYRAKQEFKRLTTFGEV